MAPANFQCRNESCVVSYFDRYGSIYLIIRRCTVETIYATFMSELYSE